MTEKIATRVAYGKALLELGEKNTNIVVLDADLSKSTTTAEFSKKFPTRFFNMGVAEANMMNTAAGLATCGKIPFVSTFCIFAVGRAWEQIRNTVTYCSLNVKIVATHSGVAVGGDGSSHQAIEDIAITRAIPTLTVIEPCDAVETRKAVFAASEYNGPVYIRLGRAPVPIITKPEDEYKIGRGILLKKGDDVTIVACGTLVANALDAASILDNEGIKAAVINMHTLKPIDKEILIKAAKETGAIVTAEQHVLDGGLGSAVAAILAREHPTPMEFIGIDNRFGQSGEPEVLFKHYHLTAQDIVNAVRQVIKRKVQQLQSLRV